MIHPTADIKTKAIGEGSTIWQFVVILDNAVIGKWCNINAHVFIENEVKVGNYVTVKSGVQLWDGIEIQDHVFIGPNVTFTNDKTPRSKHYPAEFQKTKIHHHASIGAGAIILGGIEIGAYAMIGAGSLVTKEVPERALIIGNPARIVGWMNEDGSRMRNKNGRFIDKIGNEWIVKDNRLTQVL